MYKNAKPAPKSLADALFGKTRKAVIAKLFGHPERSWHLRELAREADVSPTMLGKEIDTAVRARRPAGANSVAIYLATRPEFVHLPDGTWVLATWPEAAAIKGKPRVPSLGERIADVAIAHLKAAPREEARLRDLVYFVASKIDVPTPTIYPYFDRHPRGDRKPGFDLPRLGRVGVPDRTHVHSSP